jgi:hypothetical protein
MRISINQSTRLTAALGMITDVMTEKDAEAITTQNGHYGRSVEQH